MLRVALVLVSLIVTCVTARAGGLADADAGIARLNAGDPTAAVALFTRAIQSKELSPEVMALAYYHRGMAFHREGQAGRAILDYSTALWNEDLPKDFRPRALNNRGLAFEAISDFESAMRDYSLAIRLNPNYAEAFANRGNVHRRNGLHDQALLDYDVALRNGHPRPQFVFAWQGMALENQGKRREAMDSFRRALQIDPTFELAKSRLTKLEDTQQMSKVLGRRKSTKPAAPYVLTAAPGRQAGADESVQLTPWTPSASDAGAREPLAAVSTPSNKVSLRPAYDDQPQALTSPSIVIQSNKPPAPAAPARSVAAPAVALPQPTPKPRVIALSTRAPEAAVPPPSKPRIIMAPTAAPTPVPQPEAKAISATGEGGTDVVFAIQLGSFETRDEAEAGWTKALKIAGDLLSGLSHAVEPVTVSEKVKYRLFGEALPDRQAALSLCRTLRDKGAACIVVRR